MSSATDLDTWWYGKLDEKLSSLPEEHRKWFTDRTPSGIMSVIQANKSNIPSEHLSGWTELETFVGTRIAHEMESD
jgi:hypothetical protein